MIHKNNMHETFCTLAAIDSPSKEERAAADWLKARLALMGADIVEEDAAGEAVGANSGNVIAKWEATAPHLPSLLFSAHMDCVSPCRGVRPVLENGVYRSQGDTILGSDDKAGITAILEGIRCFLAQEPQHGAIWAVFTICEEIGLLGAKHFTYDVGTIDMAYALDISGAPGGIVVRAPGQNSLHITLHGKTAHAGLAPETGINALVMAARGIAASPCGRIDEETTANIGIVRGGTATNIVPDTAVIEGEVRSLNPEKLVRYTADMKAAFETAAAELGGTADILVESSYEPMELAANSPTVTCAKAAAESLGFPVRIESTGGGSDANVFCRRGLPMAILAVGMTHPHTTKEELQEIHLYQSGAWVYEILRQAHTFEYDKKENSK